MHIANGLQYYLHLPRSNKQYGSSLASALTSCCGFKTLRCAEKSPIQQSRAELAVPLIALGACAQDGRLL